MEVGIVEILTKFFQWVFAEAIFWLSLKGRTHVSILLIWLFPSCIVIVLLSLFFREYQEKSLLQVQATTLVERIEVLLDNAAHDTAALADLSQGLSLQGAQSLISSYISAEIYPIRTGYNTTYAPMYARAVMIDEHEQEILVFKDNILSHQRPQAVTLVPLAVGGREDSYYQLTKAAGHGNLFVSHLERMYRAETGPKEVTAPDDFEGYIVFGRCLFDAKGSYKGVLLLYFDFRHIVEVLRHFDSLEGIVNTWDYDKANYASLIDDQGWFIAHPRLSHIRGYDSNGHDVESLSSDDEVGKRAMRVQLFEDHGEHTKTLKRIYDALYIAMQKQQDGATKYANVAGQPRLLVYKVVHFTKGQYQDSKIFGGIWVGRRISIADYWLTYPTLFFPNLDAGLYAALLVVLMVSMVYFAFRLSTYTGLLGFINSQSAPNRKTIFRDFSSVDLRGETCVILSCAISDFDKLCEQYAWNLEQVGTYVSAFYQEMTQIVSQHNGAICNKFNDRIDAVYGVFDKAQPGLAMAAEDALNSAVGMMARFEEITTKHNVDGNGTLYLRIVIRSGPALVGNVAKHNDERFSFTAIGSIVITPEATRQTLGNGYIALDNNTFKSLTAEFKDAHRNSFRLVQTANIDMRIFTP